jgi:hypothetical protein
MKDHMLRIPTETAPEDEWDPQGLNSITKDELESFSDSGEEGDGTAGKGAGGGVDPSDDLEKDGLAELEEMEQQLQAEKPILDFAMITEEE